MNIQDLIDDCNKQIEWINNKDEYNVNALQFASYFKERLIEINKRTCESCRHFQNKINEEEITCNYHCGFYPIKYKYCGYWESKDD
jgi:uncharacterized UPF0160 family protein